MLIGAQGSGKTTWMRQHLLDHPATIISSDEIIEKLAETFDETYSTIWHAISHGDIERSLNGKLRAAVGRRENIIIDRTNMSCRSRRKLLTMVPECYTKKAVVFLADRAVLLNRIKNRAGKIIDEAVLDATLALYDAPTIDEFDSIEVLHGFPLSHDST